MENQELKNNEETAQTLPWYKEGLRFKCTECGKCCTGSAGFVWVSEEEMIAMAASLQISLDLFKRKYVRRRDNRYALVEKKTQNKDEFACIFLNGKKCDVYQNRPKQCRTYPWWQENLNTEKSWQLAAEACEGINENAPLVPYSDIIQLVKSNEEKNKSSSPTS